MKYYLSLFLVVTLVSCSDAFIKHEMKVEKLGPCVDDRGAIQMLSNINGERYTFNECLEAGFDGKNYNVERNGDSIYVKFPSAALAGDKQLFKLTLDVDAKPAYHHIFLNGREVHVVPYQ